MGSARRPQPERLAAKLREIRLSLGLSQQKMLERLDYQKSPLYVGHISEYELGKREPPLPVLLRYAKVARVPLEALVDDQSELSLPAEISS